MPVNRSELATQNVTATAEQVQRRDAVMQQCFLNRADDRALHGKCSSGFKIGFRGVIEIDVLDIKVSNQRTAVPQRTGNIPAFVQQSAEIRQRLGLVPGVRTVTV